MDTELRRLEPSLLADWLAFFDGDAFSDNKDWGTCYCRCFVFGGGGFDAWDAACAAPGVNRAAMVAKIGAGGGTGPLRGRAVGPLLAVPLPRVAEQGSVGRAPAEHDDPIAFGGTYRVATLRKPGH